MHIMGSEVAIWLAVHSAEYLQMILAINVGLTRTGEDCECKIYGCDKWFSHINTFPVLYALDAG